MGKTDVPSKYGVEGIPVLLNSDGKIIAKDLRGGSLNGQLEEWLK
jgi:hypothetical protein